MVGGVDHLLSRHVRLGAQEVVPESQGCQEQEQSVVDGKELLEVARNDAPGFGLGKLCLSLAAISLKKSSTTQSSKAF